jgi:TonB-linked SusC/RagA family outer membrane protein
MKQLCASILTLVFLLVFVSRVEAQNVTKTFKNVPLSQVLKELENQTGYSFIYNKSDIISVSDISGNFTNSSLTSVLDQVILPPLKYEIKGKIVAITKTTERPQKISQKVTVTGVVMDENKEPMVGAAIIESGEKSNGVVTGLDGIFSITVQPKAVLNVSCIGYNTLEVKLVEGKTQYDIFLTPDKLLLDELVVIGYGSVKKSDLTYSVSKITSEALQERPLTTMSEAFQGNLSGVRAQAEDGVPGQRLTIRIRGTNTINGDSSPLYVIDGVPQDEMTDIAASDIASIQILKDAAATSIYGARGGNGVVLIETKEGVTSKPTVSFNAYYGLQLKEKKIDMMNGNEWIAYNMYCRNLAFKRSGGSMTTPMPERAAIYQIPESWNNWTDFTDWQDEVFQVAPIQEYLVSASNRDKNSNTYASASFFRQDGVVLTTYYKKVNTRVKQTFNVGKHFITGFNFNASQGEQNGADASGKEASLHHALMCTPLMRIDEGTRDTGFPINVGQTYPNPVERIKNTSVTREDKYLGVSIFGEVKILDGFKLKSQYSRDYVTKVYEFFQAGNVAYNNGYKTTADSWSSNSYKWVIQNTLTYDKKFKGEHNFNAVLGQSAESYNYYKIEANASDFPYETVPTLNVALTPLNAATYRNARSSLSFFGRISYDYKSKYLVTASLRYDGSSRFGANTKWGLFPSVSLGWKINEEKFMEDASWINLLKIRASWGQAGNDRIGNYAYAAKLGQYNTSWGNEVISGIAPSNIPNPNLKWEHTTSMNFGFDWSMFKNRIQLNVDYYINRTDNLLFNVTIPYSTGFDTFTDNIGAVQNMGWEIDLTTFNIKKKDFSWSTKLNISRNNNKVLSLGEIKSFSTTSYDAIFLTEVGKPISQFYCHQTCGVLTKDCFDEAGNPTVPIMTGQQEGNPRYVDQNNDGRITDADYTVCGNNLPDFTYGVTNTFSWKGLNLSILLQGQAGGEVMFLGARQYDVGKAEANQFARWLRSYKPDFTAIYGENESPIPWDYINKNGIDMSWDGKTPNVNYGAFASNDDRRIYDASYFRIKNITLRYSFPKKWFKDGKVVKGADIYMSADNVYTFSDYVGYNVEGNSFGNNTTMQGVDYSSYPLSRRIVFGGYITF